jgi:hypothetical protein
MKGIVFTSLGDMVEEKFGLETWNALLKQVELPSGGIYTAGGTYPDEEMVSLIMALSKLVKIEPAELIKTFGVYMFPVLAGKYPNFLEQKNLKDFLKSIDEVIHLEVRKLYPDASLPSITYEDPAPRQLIVNYRSPRKLCPLAIGLIHGAADHFKEKITIEHPVCMLKGADHCRLELSFEE